jgi:predicted 3-demethylubiquinone-9 3-methyltransferase (glyoxalase superfamily)
MPTITPFLWFDHQAEEAMNFYLSIFKDGKVHNITRRDGKAFTVTFEIQGQKLMALNAGPIFKFTEAISLFVSCDTQQEVDEYWDKLTAGGEPSRCGWLKDKYGLSWQIIPKALSQLLGDPDPKKSSAVMQAMLKMNKIIIADLQKAHEGAAAA